MQVRVRQFVCRATFIIYLLDVLAFVYSSQQFLLNLEPSKDLKRIKRLKVWFS